MPKVKPGQINHPSRTDPYQPGTCVIALSAYARLRELAKTAQDAVAAIRVPVLVVVAPGENVASFSAIQRLYPPAAGGRLVLFPESNHIILHDRDAAAAIGIVLDFIDGR